MGRKYHTLLVREASDQPFFISFGDYDREAVEAELDYQRDANGYPRQWLRIITTGDKQADIDAAVAKFNAEVGA